MPDNQKPAVLSNAPSAEEDGHPYGLLLRQAIAKYTRRSVAASIIGALHSPQKFRQTYEYYCNQREHGFLEKLRLGQVIAYYPKDFPICKLWGRMAPEAFAGFRLSRNTFERDDWWPVTFVPNGPPLVRIRHVSDSQPDVTIPTRSADPGKYKYDREGVREIIRQYLIQCGCKITRGAQAECIGKSMKYLNEKGQNPDDNTVKKYVSGLWKQVVNEVKAELASLGNSANLGQ